MYLTIVHFFYVYFLIFLAALFPVQGQTSPQGHNLGKHLDLPLAHRKGIIFLKGFLNQPFFSVCSLIISSFYVELLMQAVKFC